ncbi:MAG: hypothetical protein J6Q55_02370 [Clostridia bacterium]|nr:hypothetical protein [Clostridia bacterium]
MKYCPKCNVNVHHQLKTCPLCGQYLDPKNDNEKCAIYTHQEQIVQYPILKEQKGVPFFKSRFNTLLLAVMAFLIAIDLLSNKALSWSMYTTIGIVFVLACVMLPINRKLKLSAQIRIDMIVLTILGICLELVICKGKFQWFVVEFVLPCLYIAGVVLVDFLMIFSRRKSRFYSTLIYCTLFSLLPQIMLWICGATGWYYSETLTDSFVFFASLLHFVVVSVALHKYVREEMERRLSM